MIDDKLMEQGYSRGSNSDISRHKRSWVAHKDIKQENGVIDPSQELISDRISRAAAALREEVYAEVNEEIKKIKQDAEQYVNNSLEKIEHLKFAFDDLLKEKEMISTNFEKLENNHADLQARYEEMAKKFILCEEREKITKVQLESSKIENAGQIQKLEEMFQKRGEEFKQELAKKDIEYSKNLSEYKDVMETDRHQWIKIHDDLMVQNNKLLTNMEKLQITQQDSKNENRQLNVIKLGLEEDLQLWQEKYELLERKHHKTLEDLHEKQVAIEEKQSKVEILEELTTNQNTILSNLPKQLELLNSFQEKLSQQIINLKIHEVVNVNG